MRKLFLILVLIALVAGAASADDGQWTGRLRLISISPDASSDTIGATGTGADVDSAITLEVDVTYMFNDRWGLEVIAATAEHDIEGQAGALDEVDLGSIWVLPPTFTLQYHFATDGPFKPYVGAGVNFTLFYSYDISAPLTGLGVGDIDFDSSIGLAAQIGADYELGDPWLLNFDVKYIDIGTDAEIQIAGGGVLDTIGVDIDPWVFGIGFGRRF